MAASVIRGKLFSNHCKNIVMSTAVFLALLDKIRRVLIRSRERKASTHRRWNLKRWFHSEKRHQVIFVRRKFENASIAGHFRFALEENSGRLLWCHRFRKASLSKCFPSIRNAKPLSKSSVFVKEKCGRKALPCSEDGVGSPHLLPLTSRKI